MESLMVRWGFFTLRFDLYEASSTELDPPKFKTAPTSFTRSSRDLSQSPKLPE